MYVDVVMEKTLKEAQDEVIEEFSMYDDWLDKYSALIEMGNSLESFPEELKTEDRLIKGCQSRVWLDAQIKDGRVIFRADSDALITKGIIALLVSVYSGRKADEIAKDDFSFVERGFILSTEKLPRLRTQVQILQETRLFPFLAKKIPLEIQLRFKLTTTKTKLSGF